MILLINPPRLKSIHQTDQLQFATYVEIDLIVAPFPVERVFFLLYCWDWRIGRITEEYMGLFQRELEFEGKLKNQPS